ncbi:MAG: ABC transporter substrate-binding protein [Pseudomonadota bacterium]
MTTETDTPARPRVWRGATGARPAALLAAATLALAALPAGAEEPTKLRLLLDWYLNPDHAPIVMAEELGYFAEAGLEVEVIQPADPAAPPRLVAAGQADLAVSYQIQLHLQVDEGLPVAWVGTLVATPLNCLLVMADSGIESPADLAGKTIGYSVPGVEEALLGAILAEHGVAMEAVDLVNVNFSLSPALMTGQVDAVIGAYRNFELNQLEIEGEEGRCFYIEEEGLPAHDELIYVAHAETVDREAVARFLEAVERATMYIINHPDESWETFKATDSALDDALNAKAWVDTLPRLALRPAAFDAGRYARLGAFLAERGLTGEPAPVSRLAVQVHDR